MYARSATLHKADRSRCVSPSAGVILILIQSIERPRVPSPQVRSAGTHCALCTLGVRGLLTPELELETGRTGSPRLPTPDSPLPSLSQDIGRPREPAYGYGHGRRGRRTRAHFTRLLHTYVCMLPAYLRSTLDARCSSRSLQVPCNASIGVKLSPHHSMHAHRYLQESSIKFNALPADRPSRTSNSPLATNRPARGTR